MFNGVQYFWQQRIATASQPTLPDTYLVLGEPISAWPLYQPPGHSGKIGAAIIRVRITEERRGTRTSAAQYAQLTTYLEFVLVGENPLTLARFGRNLVNRARSPDSRASLTDTTHWSYPVVQNSVIPSGLPVAVTRYEMIRDPASKFYRIDCELSYRVMSSL